MSAGPLKPALAGIDPATGEVVSVGLNTQGFCKEMREDGLIIVPVDLGVARRCFGEVCDDVFALASEVAS